MFIIQEIASALIAGVIVVVVDWRRLLRRPASAAPQNQANCNAQKFARWAAMCYAGLAPKSLDFPILLIASLLRYRSTPPPPQNQLHLANCKRPKSCTVGCDVLQEVGALKVS